jgi:Mg-chelatase subunit ChlD
MIVAAISFSDPLMLAGLLAALVPVFLHLLNRVRAPVLAFPTLRFLRITAQKTARRRRVQQYFLLLLRVIVFAMAAMAVAAPLIRGGSAGLAYGFVGMLLGGLALLVLAGVWSAAALERRSAATPADSSAKAKGEAGDKTAGTERAPPVNAAAAGRKRAAYLGLSVASLLAAVLLAGAAGYGLLSDRYFSGERGRYTGESTAMVIVLDNSQSMLARSGGGGTRLARARETVRQLLGETLRPAEAALLPTNPGEQSASMPLTRDATRLLGYLDKLEPRGRTLPMQERIRLGVDLLERSRQPNHVLVVVSDFARPAFADPAVFAGIKESEKPASLQVVLMPVDGEGAAGGGATVADVGIVSFKLAEGSERPAVGTQLTFEAELINNGDAADVRDFTFTVDGKPVDGMTSRVPLGAAGTGGARTVLRIPYRLKQPGEHRYGVMLDGGAGKGGSGDGLEWDDHRELALEVAEQVKVLVVGAEAAPRARSTAYYTMAALAPFDAQSGVPWSIRPTYRGVAGAVREAGSLGQYGAVFLCDVPQVPAALAEGLGRYVRGGGRVVWMLGPSVDGKQYNEVAGRQGLLPGNLAAPAVSAKASPLEWVELRSGPFANLFDSQAPFRSLLVTGRWTMETGGAGGGGASVALAKLADGTAILTEHAAGGGEGSGKVYTLMTTPGAAWSNLGATVLLVPLASRMALGDAQQARGESSFETGDVAPIRIPGAFDAAAVARTTVDVTMPGGGVLNVKGQLLTETPRWPFDRTLDAGVYPWRSSDGKASGMIVVNPPGEEADLLRADVEGLARESTPRGAKAEGKGTIVAGSAAEVLAKMARRSEGTSLVPGFLAMVLMLAVVEALMANRYRGGN